MVKKSSSLSAALINRSREIKVITIRRGAIIKRARESINGVRIGNIRRCSGLKRLLNHTLRPHIEPLTQNDWDFSVGLLERI
ncbi:hypothetical protein SDJN02_09124 [Cucurbita argyrosperma subsp. argyrosperma]|nr:hypothetical protein SDJN02_09124 [Cucurbita argyrosperma subsp. argyrosperma]